MGTTPNLGLNTYNTAAGSATSLLNYRLAIAGESSNMTILDSYLGGAGVSGSIQSLNASSVRNVDATWSSSNFFTGTASGITTYLTGQIINVKFNTEIAGDTTININSVGNTVLKKLDLQGTKIALASGDLLANLYYSFIYDGTNFVLMNQLGGHITISGSPSNFISISASNVLQDSGVPILIDVTTGSYNQVLIDEYGRVVAGSIVSGGGGVAAIVGEEVMSSTTGSTVIHNESGISTGSYNQIEVDIYGHITSGSITAAGGGIASISGEAVMSSTSGSFVVHNTSGISSGSYNQLEVDEYGHVTAGSIVSGGTSGSGITETVSFYGSYSGCEIDAYYTITIIDGLITSWNEQQNP